MFGFTRKTDYALVALVGLAEPPVKEADQQSARQIAERFDLPLPALMGILKCLMGVGLVRSTRGPRGGYSLARKPADISVNDVVSAIEGPVSVTNCCNASATRGARVPGDGSTHCRIQGRCPISISVRGLNRQIGDYLSHVTLADLMRNDGRPFASSEPTSLHPASGSLKEEAQ